MNTDIHPDHQIVVALADTGLAFTVEQIGGGGYAFVISSPVCSRVLTWEGGDFALGEYPGDSWDDGSQAPINFFVAATPEALLEMAGLV